VSTVAKALDDQSGLADWKVQIVMRGLARQPSILADLRYVAEKPIWEMSDTGARWEREWKLSDYNTAIEEARELGGGNEASRWGTALHGLAELFDAESYTFPDDGSIPDDLMGALDRYVELTKDIEMLACEGFVVHDEWHLAGSYDRLGLLPDGRLAVMDIKTSPNIHQNVSSAAIQMAAYARGTHYHPDGTRDLGLLEHIDQSVGFIIQISRDNTGDRLLEVDLNEGWRRAELARKVREDRKMKPRGIHSSTETVPPF
jgi:hypothetical protein